MTKHEREAFIRGIRAKVQMDFQEYDIDEVRILLHAIDVLKRRVQWWVTVGSKRQVPWSKLKGRR